jgi:uncharacterized protein YxjI
MKLYMKQKVFSWKDKATVKDEYGEDKYYIEGKVLSIGKKLRIYDMHEQELAYIEQKVLTIMPKFTVFRNGTELAKIAKKFTVLKHKYVIEGLGWEVEGDFLGHDYTISDAGRPIASVHKKWMSWGDTYELFIDDSVDEVNALAVVLAIDAVLDASSSSTASTVSFFND